MLLLYLVWIFLGEDAPARAAALYQTPLQLRTELHGELTCLCMAIHFAAYNVLNLI
jgi:hypothetical protein